MYSFKNVLLSYSIVYRKSPAHDFHHPSLLPRPSPITVRKQGSTHDCIKIRDKERIIMPYITVKMLEGRSEDQKKALVEKVTQAVSETTGASEDKIVVFIEEMSKGHYAVGGKRLSDQ
jgi:4-oxalocrotonate tautomerase